MMTMTDCQKTATDQTIILSDDKFPHSGDSALTLRHANGFDGLRLLAALLVLFSHCYQMMGVAEQEPLTILTINKVSLGKVGVAIFFAMSGYLVTLSWQHDPNAQHFLSRRLLRIVPGLAFLSALTFLAVGPWMTTLTAANYFHDFGSWRYLLNALIYPVQHHLPGVFLENPFPNDVNGALWTLPVEFSLYLIVALMGRCGLWRWRWMASCMCLLCLLAWGLYGVLSTSPFLGLSSLGVPFFLGAAFARREGGFSVRKWHCEILLVALAITLITPVFKPVLLVAITFFAVFAAQRLRLDFSRIGDYSYGIYLWGAVTQQSLIHLLPSLDFISYLILSFGVTFGLSFLSWHLVEKRALRLKPKPPANAVPTQPRHQH